MLRYVSWMALPAILCGIMIPSISHPAVGRMAGTAATTATGAATYSIPINVPPGTNGLSPRLAFAYHHHTGPSPLGVGWSIGGLSTITRCASTFAQDGVSRDVRLDAQDRFCLDGQKLRLTSGTYGQPNSQYATEIESFSRATAYGSQGFGPVSFTVERQDGLIYDYGATGDSRIEAQGYSSVRTWAVNRIRDRAGNAITFSYAEDTSNGSYQISSIQYAGNPNVGIAAAYQISFVYETLPVGEVSSRYLAGALVKRVVRLQQVNITHGGDLVRQYGLTYEPTLSNTARSRLRSIEECAGVELDCLPATTFGYQNGTPGFLARVPIATIGGPSNILVLDINGDGRSDVVYSSSAASGAGTWMYALANSAGGFDQPVNSGIANYNFEGAIAIDYNADGLEDMLVPYSGGTWWVVLGTASGLAMPVDTGIGAETAAMGHARAMDVNGDGLDDLIWAHYDTPGGQAIHYRPRILGGTFGNTANLTGQAGYGVEMELPVFPTRQFNSRQRNPDFNGDGRGDLVLRYSQWDPEANPVPVYWTTVVLNGAAGFNIPNIPSSIIYYPDLNGDGYSDIVYVNESNWYYHLSRGTSFGPRITGPSISGYDVHNAVVIDSEGDGYEDLWVRHTTGNHGYLMRSTGEALLAPSNTLHYDAATAHFVADVNGDGQTDILQLEGSTLYYQLHNGVAPDLLVSAAEGLDHQISFSYSPLTSANGCYSRDSAHPSFPSRAYRGSLHVVCSMTSSDGIGGTYSISYLYSNADLHLQGRGFLGFGKRRVTDSRRTALAVFEEYSTDAAYYERLGTLLTSAVRQSPSNQPVSEISNTFGRHISNPGVNERRLPFVAQTVANEYEADGSHNGALLRTTTIRNSVDAATGTTYESETTIVEASGANGVQAGATYTHRVLQPVANLTTVQSTWCLGRPGRIETTRSHNQYGGDSVTRTEEVQWDTAKCRPTQVITEPGNAALQVTRTLDYDDFGNISSDTVTGIGMQPRSTTISWGTTGQFPTIVTNPLLQVTNLGWDPKLGLQSSETDPNGLTVSWQYDGFGRKTSETRRDGTGTTWSYANCSSCGATKIVVTETDLGTNGVVITDRQLRLDSHARRHMVSARALSGSHSRIEYEYDALGRLTRESAPCWPGTCTQYGTSYSYDLRDRVSAITYPVSNSPTPQTAFIYYEGQTTRHVDALGKQSIRVRNALGGMARSIDHDGYYQHFDYDSFANVVRVTDSLGNTLTTNTFNSRGMTTSQADLVAGTRSYTVNALGETRTQTDTKNQLVQFEYDLLGRLEKRSEPEGDSTWVWGTSAVAKNIGRLSSVSGPGYSESYTYDAVGRVQSRTINSDGSHQINYAYNTLGALHTLTYPTSTLGYRLQVQYEYRNGFLYRARDASAPSSIFWTANDTDARGGVISETLGNGVQTLRGFDAATGRLDYIQSSSGGASIQDLNYRWNEVGNLFERQDARQGLTENFYYDNLHRLTSTSGPDPVSFTYDARGNILTSSGSSVSNGPGHTVTWTSYNQPESIASPGGSASSQFFYAPDRSRYKQVANYGGTLETTVHIGGVLDKITVGSTQIWRHYIVGGSGAIAVYTRRSTGANDVHYLTRDHLGSIDSVTDSSGAVEVRTSFGAFGQRRKEAGWSGSLPNSDWTGIASTTRRGFTDHEMLDNLRLTHMNGRVYDPQVGQFLSPDPFVPDPGFTQSFNRYSYVFNNPLSFVDPGGYDPTHVEPGKYKISADWDDWMILFDVPNPFDGPLGRHLNNLLVWDFFWRNPWAIPPVTEPVGPLYAAPVDAVAASTVGGTALGVPDWASTSGICLGGCHGTMPQGPLRPMTPEEAQVLDVASAIVTLPLGGELVLGLRTAGVFAKGGLQATRVTEKGIARIERHLTRTPGIEPGPAELRMIERLRAGNRTSQDLRFYQHELMESRVIAKYRRLFEDPVDAARGAHHETLIRQGLYRRGYENELYSPDALRLIGE